jgi:dTDP-4-dehydrorhamnose reductase
MTVLVLGHSGMLGNCVSRYLQSRGYRVHTVTTRWDSEEFKADIISFKGEYIVNCIGSLPNKGASEKEIIKNNLDLPLWLLSHSRSRMIFAGSDGEYSGSLAADKYYEVHNEPDASDVYGITKAEVTRAVKSSSNARVIRCSVIGVETSSSDSLLSWFLQLPEASVIQGYTNVLWNGITTLEWAKIAETMMREWDSEDKEIVSENNIVQAGSAKISKYELLLKFAEVFGKKVTINKAESKAEINRCLFPSHKTSDIDKQLTELRKFYEL